MVAEPLAIRISLRILRLVQILVPRTTRQQWLQEWEAEIRHRGTMIQRSRSTSLRQHAELVRRSTGSVADAAWLRRQFAADLNVMQDVRYAFRTFGRAAGWTATIVLTLALGIGSTTAIFSVVNAVLLRPLPYANPDRLVQIVENVPAEESFSGVATRMSAMSSDEVVWWRANSQTLSHMAIAIPDNRTLAISEGTVRLPGASVSPALFAMRGVPPVLGRGLVPEDERTDAAVVVISEWMWRRYFAADQGVLGGTVSLDGRPYTVVGIMPPAFGREAYWTPFVLAPAQPGQFRLLPVTARLADGVSIDAASAEVNVLGSRLRGVELEPGTPARFEIVRELDQVTARVAPALRVLVASVAIVLLIVGANVANLLLVRGTKRREEFALRRTLGATPGRIARQVLTESMVLAGFGSIIGLALAYGAVRLLKALAAVELRERFASTSLEILPRLDEIAIDPSVLAFTVVLSLASGALFGTLPAWRMARFSEASERSGPLPPAAIRKAFLGRALATAQLGLAMMLLIGAGLLLHSFFKLTAVDTGFDARNVLSFELVIPGDYTSERKLHAAEELVARLRTHPQISRIGFTDIPPLTQGIALGGGLLPVGSSEDDVQEEIGLPMEQRTQQRYASAGYLRALGAQLRSGRWIEEGDGTRSGIAALVSRPYAQRYFPSSSPLGATIQSTLGLLTIVGVIDDLHLRGPDKEPERIVFVEPRQSLTAMRAASNSAWQTPEADRFFLTLGTGSVAFAARTTGDPLAIAADVRGVARQIDPALAVDALLPMEEILSGSTTRPRFYAVLLSVFGGVAALIAMVGIYGVLAYIVGQRTKEIGIRMALGAERGAVMRLMLRQGAPMVAIGVCAGLAGALGLTRYLKGMLFGVSSLDAATFGAVAVLFATVALFASYLPARRATRIDPLVALRHE